MTLLEAHADVADGIMAHEGKWFAAETFLSFDNKAVTLLSEHGKSLGA
jgi:predicted nucleic-acid-binding protein